MQQADGTLPALGLVHSPASWQRECLWGSPGLGGLCGGSGWITLDSARPGWPRDQGQTWPKQPRARMFCGQQLHSPAKSNCPNAMFSEALGAVAVPRSAEWHGTLAMCSWSGRS